MITRPETLAQLKHDSLLSQMYKRDQKKVDDVIGYLLQCTDPIFKPVYHDVLVRMITGSDSDFRASAQERALINFVDGLLPDMPDEEEEDDVICDDPIIIRDKGIY